MTDISVLSPPETIQVTARGPRGIPGPTLELRIEAGVLEWRVVKANPDPWASLIDLGEFLTDSEAAATLAQKWAAEDEDVVVDGGLYSALHYAAKALASANSANSDAGTASGAKTDAEDARDLAEKWAAEDEDVVVSGGLYSARHYAAKANADASSANSDAGIASSAKTDAESARDLAEKWADEDEDVAVEPGSYSAKHHAAKAAQSALDAAESASSVEPFNTPPSITPGNLMVWGADERAAADGGAPFSGSYEDLSDIPSAFPPSIHSHAISDVTNLDTELAAKQATSEKGAANGYASLDSDGKVPAAQLPTYIPSPGDIGSIITAASTAHTTATEYAIGTTVAGSTLIVHSGVPGGSSGAALSGQNEGLLRVIIPGSTNLGYTGTWRLLSRLYGNSHPPVGLYQRIA